MFLAASHNVFFTSVPKDVKSFKTMQNHREPYKNKNFKEPSVVLVVEEILFA